MQKQEKNSLDRNNEMNNEIMTQAEEKVIQFEKSTSEGAMNKLEENERKEKSNALVKGMAIIFHRLRTNHKKACYKSCDSSLQNLSGHHVPF